MMASQSAPVSGRIVGDYMLRRQIGSGSFSVVWHARHRVLGTEVAVKEIAMDRLSSKLQDSLLSEIAILKRIAHPNIIALHDIIEGSGRIYLVLEYCRGGDLSMYLHRHGGRVPEAKAKYFMQQLAAGLQVLCDNNLAHRDLKPQNLLLSSDDENSVLKIADFGFARLLQPRGLAETLCGSPLYMAPEIMQLQKYDAKADLWSVGTVLFQLVTGRTPFTGSNQIQLLQNIVKSNDVRFPPDINLSYDCIDLCRKLLRRNPVERLTFQEFFNHKFLSQYHSNELLSQTICRRDDFPFTESSPTRHSVSSQEECLPFLLDDESSGQDGSPSARKDMLGSAHGSSVDNVAQRSPVCSPSKIGILPRYTAAHKREATDYMHDSRRPLRGNIREMNIDGQRSTGNVTTKDSALVDSLEFIDQDYVIVPGPPLEMSSSSASTSYRHNSSCKRESLPVTVSNFKASSAPVPIVGAAMRNACPIESLESHSSPASGTSQGSIDLGDAVEQPSLHCISRIRLLQQSASVITELVKEEAGNGRRLEAFSIQLVVLAIWKQALHICHAQVASAVEGSPSQEPRIREKNKEDSSYSEESISSSDSRQVVAVCSHIEREFLKEIANAEELAVDLARDETTEMPYAIEFIYQSALTIGRQGAVDEMMNNTERAAGRYSKAVCLLRFLLLEAPSLVLNPPLSLTNSDRHRLRSFINVLNNRQSQSHSQRLAFLQCTDK